VRTAVLLIALWILGTTEVADAKTTLVNAGVTLDLPAGWTYQQSGAVDQLTTPGQAAVDVSVDARMCPARPATSNTPVWIKANVWLTAEAVTGGVTLCVQRETDSLAITVRDNAAEPVVTLIADTVNPPVAIGKLALRFPYRAVVVKSEPADANGDASAFVAIQSDVQKPAGVQITLRDQPAHCSDEFVATLDAAFKPSAVKQPFWSEYNFESDKARAVCLDLRSGIVIARYFIGLDTMMPLLLELVRVQALGAFGEPTVYDGTVARSLPVLQRELPATAGIGAWKLFQGSDAGFTRGDGLMGLDNPYSVIVAAECINGMTPLPPDVAIQVFPPSGDGAFEMSSASRWIGTQCVKTVLGNFTVVVIGPNGSTKLTTTGIEKLRALVFTVESALGQTTTTSTVTHVDTGGGGAPAWTPSRALPIAGMVYGGLATFEPTELRDRYLAPFAGIDARINKGAFVTDIGIMLGRGGDEFIGEIRTMAGLNLPLGVANLSVMGGAGVGSIGPGAAVDLAAEASLAIYSAQSSMLLARGMRAWGVGPGGDHDELELRLAGTSKYDVDAGGREAHTSAFFLGVRYIKFGDSTVEDENFNDVPVPNGHAFLFFVGAGGLSTSFDYGD
jgi:hypothetical protein